HNIHLHSFPTRRSSDLVRTSHIMVKMDADEDSIEAYTKVMLIKDFINGKPNPANLKKYEAMVKASLKISKTSPAKDTLAAFNKIDRKSTRLNSSHVAIS